MEAIKKICPESEFKNDLGALIKSFTSLKKTSSELTVQLTDDPIDLLLCGTDIDGSCQRLDGNPSLNKGLLGYLIDGKIKLVAIKDKTGKILARSLLRILLDGEKPVLYLERLYPSTITEKQTEEIINLAKNVATKLAIPLTGTFGNLAYENELESIGSGAPFEYCDSANREGPDQVKPKGIYKISNAKLIFDPRKEI